MFAYDGVNATPNIPISYIGVAAAIASSVVLPSHQIGDLIIISALRSNSGTDPTLPAGYSSFFTSSTGAGYRIGYKFATTASETSGTWTGATSIIAMVYRGVASLNLVSSNYTSSTTIVNYETGTLDNTDNTSWLVAYAYASNLGAVNNSPTGLSPIYSQVETAYRHASKDSGGTVTSWGGGTTSVTPSQETATVVIELKDI